MYQVFGIVYLIKLIRTLQDKQHHIVRARELKLRGSEQATNSKTVLKQPEDAKKEEDDEWFGASSDEQNEANEEKELEEANTPASPNFDRKLTE